MKNVPILFVLILVSMGCQKEFPPAPDYSTHSVSLTKYWQYNVPNGERVIWIDATQDDVLYLTVSDDKACSYLFNKVGELLHKQTYTQLKLSHYPNENSHKRRNKSWLSVKYLSHTALLNYRTGESYVMLEDNEFVKDSSLNYHLYENNICFYNKVDKNRNYRLIEWDLATGRKQILDTLMRSTSLSDKLLVLGIYQKPFGNIDANLLYLRRKYELFNGVYVYNLLGYAYDDFFGNIKWESMDLFRNENFFYNEKVIFHNTLCYFTIDKTLYCLDPVHQKIKWMRSLGDPIASQIKFYDNKLYFTQTNGVTYCLNATSSEVVWTKSLGKFIYKMDATNQLLGVIGLKKINNELFGDQTNQLQILEARTGKELYKSDDPLKKGNVPVNNPYKGLSGFVAQIDDIIFLADDTHFFTMRMRREN